MRKFQVTVNGNTYEVDVEEVTGGMVQTASAPVQVAPQAAATTQTPSPTPAGGEGAIKLEAPMQGAIVKVLVTAGQKVNEGDVVAILEAMKMENEIVAPSTGTVATVNTSVGASVEAGDLIVTLN